MLLRLPYARPAPSTARWRPPGLERARAWAWARPAQHLRRGHAAASSTDGGGAPLHYDPLADLLGPDLDTSPSQYGLPLHSHSHHEPIVCAFGGDQGIVKDDTVIREGTGVRGVSSLRERRNTAPVAEKGKLRSWVGPNGQYYRELPCPNCRSRGYTPCKECGIDRSSLDCPMCNGKGIRMCMQCGGECVIWQESIDEQPWEEVRSSSPLKVKEDDDVDKLDIKINTSKRSKRTYPSPSPEVAMKISRSLRSLNAKTGLFTKHMKIIHQDAKLHAQRVAAIKRTKGTAAARNHASEKQKAFFRDPENRLKRSIAMKGVKFYCSKCGQEGHRSFYCPTVRESSTRVQFRCRLCGGKGHNSRTCGKTKSENEHQRQPRHCSQCGEKGHNRRNCPGSPRVEVDTSGYIIKKVNRPNSGINSCSFCSEKGHNRRTCPKRNASLG